MKRGYPSVSGNDWISKNSRRKYPISESCSPMLSSGDPLPPNVIADATLVIALAPGAVEISSVSVVAQSVTVEFSSNGMSIGVAKAVMGRDLEGDQIPILSSRDLVSGWVIFGSILSADPGALFSMAGIHQMSGIFLESRCLVFCGPPPISSVSAWDGDQTELSGDVSIIPSGSLTVEASTGDYESFALSIGLVDPASFLPDCVPPVLGGNCGCPGAIKFINGVSGNPETGNLRLVVISPPGAPAGSIWAHPARNAVSILVTTPRKFLCIESPIVPDQFGRLGPQFDSDCPPTRNYGLMFSGPDCDNPPAIIPEPPVPGP